MNAPAEPTGTVEQALAHAARMLESQPQVTAEQAAEVLKVIPGHPVATLLLASNSPLAANMAFVKNMPYDPRRDLTPITGASLTNHVLMVSATSPIKSLPEFLAHAKKNPGKVSIGYSTT